MIDLLHQRVAHPRRRRLLQHMLVAEGAADIAVEPIVNLWDLAPLLVIVEEAGGRFTDLAGSAPPTAGAR